MLDAVGDEVGQIAVFAMIPHLFGRIQVGRVTGEPLEPEPVGVMRLHVLRRGPMDGVTVPYEHDLAPKVSVHLGEEPDHIVGLNVMREKLKVESQRVASRRDGDGGDGRETIVTIPSILQRRLPTRRPCPASDGLHHEPAFIEKYDDSLLRSALFLSAAILAVETFRWRIRRAPARVAPAFGKSIRDFSAVSTHEPDDTSPRDDARSLPRRVGTSTGPWNNRRPAGRALGFGRVASFVPCSALAWHRDGAWPSGHQARSDPQRPSTASPKL